MDDSPEVNSWIGVVISIVGNILISVALNVQKLAHNRIKNENSAIVLKSNNSSDPTGTQGFFPDDGYPTPRNSEDSAREDSLIDHQEVLQLSLEDDMKPKGRDSNNYLHNPLWWTGIVLMIFGELGNFIGKYPLRLAICLGTLSNIISLAYGFAPASTIAPLGTTTLISNVVMAPLILRETFRLQGLVGVSFAIVGASTVVFSSKSEELALSPELIMESLTQLRSIIYFAISGAAIITLTAMSPRYGAQSIMVDLGLVAIYGGYTVLATKSISSLLSMSFTKMFTFPVSYLLVFVLVFTAVIQVKYLNRALQRFDSTEVIPTQFVLFTISAIVGSAVLYHDFDNLEPHQMFTFMIGCAIEFFGVLLITSSRQKRPEPLSIQADDTLENHLLNQEDIVHDLNVESANRSQIDANKIYPIPSSPLHASFPSFKPILSRVEEDEATSGKPRNALPNGASDHAVQPPRQSEAFASKMIPKSLSLPWHLDDWQNAFNQPIAGISSKSSQHKRRSSLFAGISLTSQLVERMNEDTVAKAGSQPIHLLSTSPGSGGTSSHRRTGSHFASILSGLSSLQSDSTRAQHNTNEDAVAINIPTINTVSQRSNFSTDETGPNQS